MSEITGATKAWISKSKAILERVNTKNLSDADIEKLKEYYNRHRSNEDVTTYPMTSNTGQYYDALGHPDFTKAVKEIRKKDGTLGRPVYEPSAGITGDRAKDARLANEEMVRRFNAEDFEYTVRAVRRNFLIPSSLKS